MNNAFNYLKKNGLVLDSDYPYTAKDGKCNIPEVSSKKLFVTKYTNVKKSLFDSCKNMVAALEI